MQDAALNESTAAHASRTLLTDWQKRSVITARSQEKMGHRL